MIKTLRREIRPIRGLLLFGFLFVFVLADAQEKKCIPESIVSKKVEGSVYLSDGDTLSGEFTNLTPKNSIKTTHIFYILKGKKEAISRSRVIAYQNRKEKSTRYKVFPDKDSVVVKKQCRFDMGVFMLAKVDGPYKMLFDELKSNATIQAYNQSANRIVYYILTPENRLIKLNRNDLKPQIQSIFYNYRDADVFFENQDFNFDTVAELIQAVNASIVQE